MRGSETKVKPSAQPRMRFLNQGSKYVPGRVTDEGEREIRMALDEDQWTSPADRRGAPAIQGYARARLAPRRLIAPC
jgi:hypothetical protein